MWLVEEKVQVRTQYDRGVVKEEINKLLEEYSCSSPNESHLIRFAKKGAYVDEIFVETKCGPNRTYNKNNKCELCICISPKSKQAKEIKDRFAVQMAKKISGLSKEEDFMTMCDSINERLNEMEYKLIVLLVEKCWIEKYGNGKRVNYTTIINNKQEKKEGCQVLYEK